LPTPTEEQAPGALNYWVAIDVAAAALDVTVPTAYVIAKREHWRRTPTKPRGYLMADIRATALKRRTRNA
jgi:hypothetical protein